MSHIGSRRQFLGTMASTAGAIAYGMSRPVFAAEAGKYGPFEIGMQSYTLRDFPIDKALDTMQALGIQTIEFFDTHYPVEAERGTDCRHEEKACRSKSEIAFARRAWLHQRSRSQ